MKTILITGGTGFIGHFLITEFLKDHKIICVVRPGTKNLIRLKSVLDKITVIEYDITQSLNNLLPRLKNVDIILHAGGNPSAEDSIKNPPSVVYDNVMGTTHLLEVARKLNVERFFYYSAGELFGPIAPNTDSKETDPYNSVSPYAASKAAGEEICYAYSNTFNVPVSITHITNTFGQMSQSNRFPVIAIKKFLAGEPLDIHVGPGRLISGRRWLHAANVAQHTRFILGNQTNKFEKWNSAGAVFLTNRQFAEMIASVMKVRPEFNYVPVDRPGHETYFSLDPSKIYQKGWIESISMLDRIIETVKWYKSNPEWLTRL